MAKFELEQGEQERGKWTIHYLPPSGGKYAGKLLVTDRRILWEPLKQKQDLSLKGITADYAVGGIAGAKIRNYWDGEDLSIPRADVESVAKKKSGLMKQVVVTLADGQEFVFDYGFLSVDKLVRTLQG